eukprot:m.272660 g.272660  ORF g.272660 m.272660 type:complete len:245 (-) comp16275_c7_seq1:5335-6069(-)
MLYLDDFCESIETLPQDMKHDMSHLRSLDLRVQNAWDHFQKEFQKLCSQAPKIPQDALNKDFNKLQKELNKAFEGADEKVQLAGQNHDIIERQLRRLDNEIEKFKSELETRTPGITSSLEQQSLALDDPSGAGQISETSKRKDSVRDSAGLRRMESLKKGGWQQDQSTVASVDTTTMGAGSFDFTQQDSTLYCICNGMSHGTMVGCENENCQNGEWFHLECVGLTEVPKGKWWCPACDPKRRKR